MNNRTKPPPPEEQEIINGIKAILELAGIEIPEEKYVVKARARWMGMTPHARFKTMKRYESRFPDRM